METSTNVMVQTTLTFVREVFGSYHPRDFAVRLWDGTTWASEPGQPTRFTIVLRHPGALRAMFLPPGELSLGEAYIYDDFDIEGEIGAIFPLADFLMQARWRLRDWVRHGRQLLSLPANGRRRSSEASQLGGRRHSKPRDKQAVSFHYNRSNKFYATWLDRRMIYSCAYFATPDDDLDIAQEQKLSYACRKLRLRRGDRLLDIGCGWGGLIVYAAEHYDITAVGITLSEAQAILANQRIAAAGLTGRCRVEVADYRDLAEPSGYDKIVSVGMVEHVGKALLPTYFRQAWTLLRPQGTFLNHGIAKNEASAAMHRSRFAQRYVFPDGELVSITHTLRAAEMAGFEVRDLESLREHYILTAQHWVRRLEAHASEIVNMVGEATYRIWRLYLSAGAYGFAVNRGNVYQALLVKTERGTSALPLTRTGWYVDKPE